MDIDSIVTTEDIRKIHAEINQLVNQRFLITTLSVTISGVLLTMQIPRDAPVAGSELGAFRYMLSYLSSVLILFLFLLCHFIKGMHRICTTYLCVMNKSKWESDWDIFREKPYYGYTKPQAIIFMLLIAVMTSFPILFGFVCDLNFKPYIGLFFLIAIGMFSELLIYCMSFRGLFELSSGALKRWREVKEISQNRQK
ncbi:hypothetical protein JMF94_14280 [Desulfovibrio sp. UIB00]|uniref:hypothetical protein n=1 Tax=Desulfovibrio sp. UIB00 TaxID=2804314 RepID=UPI001F0ED955|nr:hypothetical protein [Desulfovibrio sp. UIB00]MCH5146247.1 hypothetical protein [Desulfovibrio sp. UIB00]